MDLKLFDALILPMRVESSFKVGFSIISPKYYRQQNCSFTISFYMMKPYPTFLIQDLR